MLYVALALLVAVEACLLAYLVYDYYYHHHKARRSKWPLGVHSRVASEAFPSPSRRCLEGRIPPVELGGGGGAALHCGGVPEAVACKKKVAEAEKNSFFIALLPF